jgi:hypothetical protein
MTSTAGYLETSLEAERGAAESMGFDRMFLN